MSKRVLSIGYDEMLLEDRHHLLRAAGYYVTSVLAKQELGTLHDPALFDAVLIGFEVQDRMEMLAWAGKNAPGARVIVLPQDEDLTAALRELKQEVRDLSRDHPHS
ncbi:MAG TPA: hypothetical protein VFA76_09555 [Terriglobales bacterium]|nr:hypothetical protein [Terriglobales bacterium]